MQAGRGDEQCGRERERARGGGGDDVAAVVASVVFVDMMNLLSRYTYTYVVDLPGVEGEDKKKPDNT
jgi:hypothetical protein